VVLLANKSENGLHPLQLHKNSLKSHQSFKAFLGIRTFAMGWHFRLGHSSFDLVSSVVRKFELPLSLKDFNKNIVCSSGQLGKGK
jgi:hypothetical protein